MCCISRKFCFSQDWALKRRQDRTFTLHFKFHCEEYIKGHVFKASLNLMINTASKPVLCSLHFLFLLSKMLSLICAETFPTLSSVYWKWIEKKKKENLIYFFYLIGKQWNFYCRWFVLSLLMEVAKVWRQPTYHFKILEIIATFLCYRIHFCANFRTNILLFIRANFVSNPMYPAESG